MRQSFVRKPFFFFFVRLQLQLIVLRKKEAFFTPYQSNNDYFFQVSKKALNVAG